MSTSQPVQQPRLVDRLSEFLQRSRIPLLITLIVLVVFVIVYFSWTEWERRTTARSAVQAETAQELFGQWQAEQDPDAKAAVEEELRALLQDIRRSHARRYAGQRAAFIEGNLEYQLERWQPAAEAFLSLGTRSGKSYLTPLALLNAGVSYERLGSVEDALSAYRRMAEGYKDSFLVPEVLFSIGRLEEQQGNFEEALQAYNRLEDEHPLTNWTKLGRNRIIALKVGGDIPADRD